MKNTALITGASTGIGKELADIHASKGGDLVIVARNEEKLLALKSALEEKYGIQVKVLAIDLSAADAPKRVFDEIQKEGIDITYLMNNAGFGGLGKFHERDWELDQQMIQLNITALTALTRFFLPQMVARNEGRILQVSSTASLMPGPLQAVYYATKAYVTSFSNALAEELHDTNITVTALMPGATETEFGKVSGMDQTALFKKAASARAVAEKGYAGMMKGKLDVIAGVQGSQRLMMRMLPFVSKRMKLRTVRKLQEV